MKVTTDGIMLPRGGGGAVRHGCALRLDAVGLGVGGDAGGRAGAVADQPHNRA